MSYGGKHSGVNDISSKKNKKTGGDDFGRAVSRIAVAQICESTGFQSSQPSALYALADVTIRYICGLGKAAQFYANLAGRTDCNAFDVIQGLEDLVGSSQGFTGASDVHRCLANCGVVRDISQFLSAIEEAPFPRPIPRFPVIRALKPTPSFAQIGEVPPGKHVPNWLPLFPDPHTYLRTPVLNERSTDRKADKLEQARQRRKAERSLLSLQQRISGIGAIRSVCADDADDLKGKRIAEGNPFFAPPLPYSTKVISEIPTEKEDAARKKLSVLEAFAPAIDAAKAGALECMDGERRSLPNKRQPVHFRIGVDKKSVALPLSSGSLGRRSDTLFLRDDLKDDKKRRAQMILKEAMENPQELIQL
ncbi:hypothetical protein AXF42_Ash009186 [Apostasia shenzhenica]|uniref:Transcription initiation factor TFIID subunit 8 n=1 Tax=Apostasia shenzhenica TaxID=1088818 RepID=A0A2I0ADR0_9ASPA|nr:hypothetical protein AXF42_Ash009186 [Apostasia shenzhenica]